MKKIFRYMIMAAVTVSAAAGCQMEEKVMVNPSKVIEPVLHDPGFPEVLTITPSNQAEEVCFTWDAADMGFGSQLNYSIEVSMTKAGEDGEVETEKVSLGGGVSSTSTNIKYEDINYAVVQSLGAEPEKEVVVNFYLKASLGVRPFYSAPLRQKVVPTNAPKMFPHLYFIGSYCTWNHTKAQLMYDHAENGLKYQAVIDFGENWMSTTKGGFKLTPKADWSGEFAEPEAWDKDYADRLASGVLEKNPEVVQFAAGGGDCKRYSMQNRFYHFTLSMEDYKFTMEKAFDNISLVWNGETIPLQFNAATFAQKFYADVTVGMEDAFHIVLDDKDNTVLAADQNGSHGLLHVVDEDEKIRDVEVIVAPGKYRLYVDLNNWDVLTYEFNPDMFGQEEGAASFGYKGWAICGFMNNWEGDLPMEQLEDRPCWWVAKDVLLKKDYDFCFRKDGAGAITLKGGGFKVNQPVWHYGGGADIHITQTGTYDIWLNPNNGCCWVLTSGQEPYSGDSPVRPEGASDWSVSGPLAAGGDIAMYETQYGYMAKDVELENGSEFYFRYLYRDDHSVRTTAYAGMGANTVGKVKHSTGSIKMRLEQAGKYDLYLTSACDTIYVMEAGVNPETAVPNFSTARPEGAVWGLCGSFTSWAEDLWLVKDGSYHVARNVALREMDELKFRKNGQWGKEGADGYGIEAMVKAGFYYPLQSNGGNIIVEKTGLYDIYMTENASEFYILSPGGNPSQAQAGKEGLVPWAVAGDHNGWGGVRMIEEAEYYVTRGVKLVKGQKFQFKKNNWKAQKTAGKVVSPDMYYKLTDGNSESNTVVGATGEYDIYMRKDGALMYMMSAGTPVAEAGNGDVYVPDTEEMVDIVIYGKTEHTNLYGWWYNSNSNFTDSWPGTPSSSKEVVDGVEYRKWELTVSKEALTSSMGYFIFNTEGDSDKTIDSSPMTITDGMILVEKDNVAMPKAEVLGPENISSWVIVGDFIGDWGLSVTMYDEGDYHVARMVGIPAGSVFKFRAGTTWDVQVTFSGPVQANTRYPLTAAGFDDKSSVNAAGVYDIYMTKDASAMYFMEEGKTPSDIDSSEETDNRN